MQALNAAIAEEAEARAASLMSDELDTEEDVAESAIALAVTTQVSRCRKHPNFGCYWFGC